jgi:hypothetical protein
MAPNFIASLLRRMCTVGMGVFVVALKFPLQVWERFRNQYTKRSLCKGKYET